jgi:ATP-binding cassette, subfamily B, bacterial
MHPMTSSKQSDAALFLRLLHQARPFWLHVVGILLLSLLSTPLALLVPLPLKIAVDSVLGSHPLPGFLNALLPEAIGRSELAILLVAAGLLVGIALLSQLQSLASLVLSTYTGEKLVLAFRARLFRHVQRFSLLYHDSRGTTDSIFRIQYDAPAIRWVTVEGTIPIITAVVTLTAMIYVTARIEPQLALVALGVTPFLYLATRISGRRLRTQWGEVQEVESGTLSVVQEVLGAVRVVKAFGQEEREEERFVHYARKGMWGNIRLAITQGSFSLLLGVTTAVGTAAVLFIGIGHVRSGSLTLGELLLVMGYLAQLYTPLETLSLKIADVQFSLASAERTFALLDETPDVIDTPHALPLGAASGALAFRDVGFSYDGRRPALQDISFTVEPGMRVGIVGHTGSGKTTLVSLITRFYDPTTGQVLLDGVDLREYRLADLRNQFSMVLQEPVLFSTSIAENIAYARPDASKEDVVAAARAANAHDFIVHLPNAYATQVGERGMSLSGGERQRISLARAFLRNAAILILDEPTSALDTRTESDVMEAVERLMHERTTFIIAHRLSTLERCDQLLVLENGRLVPTRSEPREVLNALAFRTRTAPYSGAGTAVTLGRHGSRDLRSAPHRVST